MWNLTIIQCQRSKRRLLSSLWKCSTSVVYTSLHDDPQRGYSSNATTSTTSSASPSKKITTLSLASQKRKVRKITMVTAYDYPSALQIDRAGIDIILVGDSCAMVELGYETTQPITLDQMIHHCQAVQRGAPNRPLLVGDMPFGTYEYQDSDIALKNAYRMIKEGGMDAVKLEVKI